MQIRLTGAQGESVEARVADTKRVEMWDGDASLFWDVVSRYAYGRCSKYAESCAGCPAQMSKDNMAVCAVTACAVAIRAWRRDEQS
jgi:hypothetical protein